MGHTPIHAILLLCLAVSYSIMRIPSHVFYFSVASIGASLASFAVYETFAKPEEEKHKILEQKFPERSKQLKASRQNMQVIFDKLDPSKKDQEFGTEIDDLLKGGKNGRR